MKQEQRQYEQVAKEARALAHEKTLRDGVEQIIAAAGNVPTKSGRLGFVDELGQLLYRAVNEELEWVEIEVCIRKIWEKRCG